ncbi:uncharacterized protein G2W53_026836 [Senna tora]|uniref:Uncharacterized protein n=1 Tax=Senna tora TaxID=362788 RepID=A0A834TI26_9FABA|nr:uncharacterized protein G2W53_026836 [Senna tora]
MKKTKLTFTRCSSNLHELPDGEKNPQPHEHSDLHEASQNSVETEERPTLNDAVQFMRLLID